MVQIKIPVEQHVSAELTFPVPSYWKFTNTHGSTDYFGIAGEESVVQIMQTVSGENILHASIGTRRPEHCPALLEGKCEEITHDEFKEARERIVNHISGITAR